LPVESEQRVAIPIALQCRGVPCRSEQIEKPVAAKIREPTQISPPIAFFRRAVNNQGIRTNCPLPISTPAQRASVRRVTSRTRAVTECFYHARQCNVTDGSIFFAVSKSASLPAPSR
jgi:hypothetical protein